MLIAIAPTVSRLRASTHVAATIPASLLAAAGESHCAHGHDGASPDEHSKKCGYCDFLTHAPALKVVAFAPAFAASLHASAPALRTASRDVPPAYALAAQPRGPPVLA